MERYNVRTKSEKVVLCGSPTQHRRMEGDHSRTRREEHPQQDVPFSISPVVHGLGEGGESVRVTSLVIHQEACLHCPVHVGHPRGPSFGSH